MNVLGHDECTGSPSRADSARRSGAQSRADCIVIDWKYLLSLELTDAGFHYSVLTEFRQRLLEHGEESILLNRILECCEAAGLLNGQSKQRTDSTKVLAKIKSLNQVTTTVATVPDSTVTAAIQTDLMARSLSPETHWVDAGYVNTDNLLSSRQNEIDLLGPARADSSWQARLEGGYDQTQFSIDWENMVATCPEGQQSMYWKEGKSSWGRANIHFLFSRPLCFQCSAREKCSRGQKNGRHLTVPPRPAFEILQEARQREQTATFKEQYRRRAGTQPRTAGRGRRYDGPGR